VNLRSLGKRAGMLSLALAIVPTLAAGPDGISGRLIVGYQGWFGCPGDFEDNKSWQHWFDKDPGPQAFTVDMLPSTRELKPEDLCDTGLRRADGQGTIKLFSSQNPNVVALHFRWLREHGIDTAAAQRFVVAIANPANARRFDHVLRNVQSAAEQNERSFFVVYDISGANAATVTDAVRKDWHHLVEDLHLTQSPAYLRDHGKPVLELWGFGLGDRPGNPEEVATLIDDLKSGRQGGVPVTLIGGVPTYWRTLDRDSKSEPQWAKIYRSYDVISPWSVGRFSDEPSADKFVQDTVIPDLSETKRAGIRYLPVVSSGFSWSNLMTNRGKPKQAVLNRTPRYCGRFLWRQIADLLQVHVNSLYVAMFDEVDEGTAIFPVETRSDKLPAGTKMVYLNEDGCSLPDDWYLKVAGAAANYLHKGDVPPLQLGAVIRP
jgi:hypothetical protein